MRGLRAVSVILTLTSASTTAYAYEDQLSLGVQAGYAAVVADTDLAVHGMALGLSASYGMNDIWLLRANSLYAYHPGSDAWHSALFGLELIYALDVLEWVPFFGAGANGMLSIVGSDVSGDGAANLVVGLDYLVSRSMIIGVDIRPYVVLTALDEQPGYLTVTLRLEFLFGPG